MYHLQRNYSDRHFHPENSIAWVAFALDSSIVGLAFFVYGFQINPVISTLLNIFLSNLVVDYMLQGLRSGYKFEIITDKPDEIRHFVHEGRKRIRNTAKPIDNARKLLKALEEAAG